MSRIFLFVVIGVGIMLSASNAQENKGQTVKGWGITVDPDGDCKFAEDNGKLTITVPGTYHDLTHSNGRDQLNSPRVLQDVQGDFSVEVKVHAFPLPEENTSTSLGICFVSSGLLIWQDGDNFIRLDRGALAGLPTPGVLVEFYEKGKQTVQAFKEIENNATNLRITRVGAKTSFEVSEDGGAKWSVLHSSEIPLPAKLSVGVLAINTTTRKFAPVLEGLKVK